MRPRQRRCRPTQHARRILWQNDTLNHLAVPALHRLAERHDRLDDRIPTSLGYGRIDPHDLVNKGVQVRQAIEVVPASRSGSSAANSAKRQRRRTDIEGCSSSTASHSSLSLSCTSGRRAKTQEAHVKAVLEVSAPASTNVWIVAITACDLTDQLHRDRSLLRPADTYLLRRTCVGSP